MPDYFNSWKSSCGYTGGTGSEQGLNDPPAIGSAKMLKRYTLKTLLLLLAVIAGACSHDFFGIIEYKPSTFVESTEKPFFFSIGRRVKFGSFIGESAPTVFEVGFFSGKIDAVYPSPDVTRAVIVSGGRLYVAEPGKAARLILEPVADYFAENIQRGNTYYKTTTLQWGSDSHSIFIARDKKIDRGRPGMEQSFSKDATLVRVELGDSLAITDLIPDFRSIIYVLFGNDVICFDYAPGNGSVVWKCARQGKILAVRWLDEKGAILEDGTTISGRPFVSHYGNLDARGRNIWLAYFRFSFKNTGDGYEGFFAKDSANLNIKGRRVDGVLDYRCIVLPGGRFVLIDVQHDNFKGQLLVDTEARIYRELPSETRVYSSVNSWKYYNNFEFSMDGCPEFLFLPKNLQKEKEACEKRSGETCEMFGGIWWSQSQYGGK
jgi:hypothetical protein